MDLLLDRVHLLGGELHFLALDIFRSDQLT